MEKHYMIDIETTGVDKETDDILEIALVEIDFISGWWRITGNNFHRILHSKRTPQNAFAIKHMADLYKRCNEQGEIQNYEVTGQQIREFLHLELPDGGSPDMASKYFMGWNASNFDLEFMFKKGMLTPSSYAPQPDGTEKLVGDVHYRVYEQTGALQLVCDMTGLNRKVVQDLAEQMIPEHVKLKLPEGKAHDALYDCYSQINMMNGLIALGRSGLRVPDLA